METLTLRDEVRDHDRDWHLVHDKETFANIDTFLQMMYLRVHYPVCDPLHSIETFINTRSTSQHRNIHKDKHTSMKGQHQKSRSRSRSTSRHRNIHKDKHTSKKGQRQKSRSPSLSNSRHRTSHKDRHKSQHEKSRSRSRSSSQHRTSHKDRHTSSKPQHEKSRCRP